MVRHPRPGHRSPQGATDDLSASGQQFVRVRENLSSPPAFRSQRPIHGRSTRKFGLASTRIGRIEQDAASKEHSNRITRFHGTCHGLLNRCLRIRLPSCGVPWYAEVVESLTNKNFGLLIAYVLPGFVILCGVSDFSPTVSSWMSGNRSDAPSVAGFLFLTLASVGCGLLASTVRWVVIDTIHHRTGTRPPEWNFRQLSGEATRMFEVLVESHYQYYQFYSNSLIAGVAWFGCYVIANGFDNVAVVALFAATEPLLFLASRDTLRRYYRRAESLMCGPSPQSSR